MVEFVVAVDLSSVVGFVVCVDVDDRVVEAVFFLSVEPPLVVLVDSLPAAFELLTEALCLSGELGTGACACTGDDLESTVGEAGEFGSFELPESFVRFFFNNPPNVGIEQPTKTGGEKKMCLL